MSNPKNIAKFSWNQIDAMTRSIIRRMAKDRFKPEAIVCILRGGAIPAVHIANLLKIRSFYALSIQTTLSDEVHAKRQKPVVSKLVDLKAIKNKRVLLVDDVLNTAASVNAAKDFINKFKPKQLKTAVLLWDTLMPQGASPINGKQVDYWIKKVHAWVVFPWNE